ncbi:DUF4389 domain-containing protein [Endozoicomonas sp. 8E]|uniref:DUF4389 domain-containing protein n=1 Tax=Endozoicomonas sp. 8E TaxID=3035692 RepID=UPI00293914F9|nr:DUF4389 domain-containing protein [Endozoicomonas sp. 8E]WOG30322.1 DUF4389 domain-containing protein [Endozoicomonas sp. 8E]
MDEKVLDNLKSESRWLRLLFMVLFYMLAHIVGLLILLIAIIQVVHGFIKSEPNARLLDFTAGLNQYFYQIIQFVTYNADTKPYPFSDWPGEKKPVNDEEDV